LDSICRTLHVDIFPVNSAHCPVHTAFSLVSYAESTNQNVRMGYLGVLMCAISMALQMTMWKWTRIKLYENIHPTTNDQHWLPICNADSPHLTWRRSNFFLQLLRITSASLIKSSLWNGPQCGWQQLKETEISRHHNNMTTEVYSSEKITQSSMWKRSPTPQESIHALCTAIYQRYKCQPATSSTTLCTTGTLTVMPLVWTL